MSQLATGELAVMRLLWEHGEMRPAEIQQRFPEPITNPALRSHLTILVGMAYFYQALTRHELAFRSVLREFVDNYCGGSPLTLLLNVIQTENLSPAELFELQRLAAKRPSSVSKREQR